MTEAKVDGAVRDDRTLVWETPSYSFPLGDQETFTPSNPHSKL